MFDPLSQIVCRLADPLDFSVTPEQVSLIRPEALFNAINLHNVGAVALKKLRMLDLAEPYTNLLKAGWQDHLYMCALVVALEDASAKIAEAFNLKEIPFTIVKGASFASRLYPSKSDRTFSDVDFLLGQGSLADAGQTLLELGYEQFLKERFDKSEANEEQKWGLGGNELMLCELHTNLVHWPALRRRISYGYDSYLIASANQSLPASGFFITAVVHAAAGHKFHTLRLLVDVLQAARNLSNDDIQHLEQAIKVLHLQPEVSAAINLVTALFPNVRNDAQLMSLLHDFGGITVPFIRGQDVWNAPFEKQTASKVRRHAYRYYQATLARRT